MFATDDAGDHAPDGELLAVPEFDRRMGRVFGYLIPIMERLAYHERDKPALP